ncbi:3-keto-5-aminohexanoate cleavage protein [Roseibium polysiphoniae]|uniref:3-keto-5-aminohexanoate cleavage protein n=1 Tax=Roseibium polysiphoniae TaxID=2571221 RepID=A0A944CF98_9HYPH|nr:3-keto-5-aminohexanoate cleavage protein [Roseibium polysiphoniae]MBS8261589.1 3-keto-5-aminohexanoate cleavage protein [Roseibium polysiphoniae]
MKSLPKIMVAPNGARRTKADHPALPMTIGETVAAAVACHEAGADGMHAHVRDEAGAHVLDAGLYRELLTEMREQVPKMAVQITTESVGKYSPAEQRKLVHDVVPEFVSIAVREMIPEDPSGEVRDFYSWTREAGIAVQHILYSAEDLGRFYKMVELDVFGGHEHQLLFVLGRYAEQQESVPSDLDPFLATMADASLELELDWGVCAFGHRETDCLVHAISNGGKARIGFENGLWNRDGELAADNADRVRELVAAVSC